MAKGDLTRHFGIELAEFLADRFEEVDPQFPGKVLRTLDTRLVEAPLMGRVRIIGEALQECLPHEPTAAWKIMKKVLPPPLSEDQKVFNDGYWMLPLAAYWEIRNVADDVALDALENLTQRGTAEFAIRALIHKNPQAVLLRMRKWVDHRSFHVRRLASEGTRPYLPWGGKLRVDRRVHLAFLKAITPLSRDSSAYVRRSVANHVRDWRRIDPTIADAWIAEADPPKDVKQRAISRR